MRRLRVPCGVPFCLELHQARLAARFWDNPQFQMTSHPLNCRCLRHWRCQRSGGVQVLLPTNLLSVFRVVVHCLLVVSVSAPQISEFP
jgi:hypothetical protein